MDKEAFFVPWSEVDPELKHGGIAGELGDGYVAPRLRDNALTKNNDLRQIFLETCLTAASISRCPSSDAEGPPTKNLVDESLRGMNRIIERIMDRTQVMATSFFEYSHVTPPWNPFQLVPIRYPLRNPTADMVINHLIGTLGEMAENSANALHSTLNPGQAQVLMAPVLHAKSLLVKDWFDKEVAGEITLAELNEIFESVARPGPTIVEPDTDQPSPDLGRVTEALVGINLIQWFPTGAEWAIFGRKTTEVYRPERIFQPEGARSTTEDVAPESPTPAPSGPPITPG